jgi:hypothetical protein
MTAAEDLPVIARFEVRRRSYLASDGSVLTSLPDFASNTGLLISLLRAMGLLRAFDLKAVALQRTGRLGTYPASLGQEAVSVGIASASATRSARCSSPIDTRISAGVIPILRRASSVSPESTVIADWQIVNRRRKLNADRGSVLDAG